MTRLHVFASLTLLLCAAILGYSISLADKVSTRELGGERRFLTQVLTDKPIYKPGETLYIRGVVLSANGNQPLEQQVQAQAMIEVRGPKGDTVSSGYVASQDSVLGFSWKIPAEQAGGEYTVKISYPQQGYTPGERKFDIRSYRAPRLKSQIVFVRDGYGPGDTVSASLHVERAEGGIPSGAKVNVICRVDGQQIHSGVASVDEKGNCTVSFKLPAQIARGEGTLALTIEDGGVQETAAKTIPILLQTVDLKIYPEGGDLIGGLPARVYIEARTPSQKPADIAGVIIDVTDNNKEAGTFRTEHEGRGRFDFSPEKGHTYALNVTQPAGIKTSWQLPPVKDSGATITSVNEVSPKEEAVTLKVGSSEGGRLSITLSKRETELSAVKATLKSGEIKEITLTPPATAEGVLIATVWDEKGTPLAERLIFRQPAKALNIEITPEKKFHVPGEQVKLTVKTTDENGKPVSAVVGMAVTDDTVLEMIDKREQSPRLPVMVFLENDVRELADAHVYLDAKNPKAPRAVDLLLGTQGWRRFAFMDAPKFLAANGDTARRVLAYMQPPRPMPPGANFGGRGGVGEADAFDGAVPVPMAAAVAAPVPQKGAIKVMEDKPKNEAVKAPAVPAEPPIVAANKPMAREAAKQAPMEKEQLAKDAKMDELQEAAGAGERRRRLNAVADRAEFKRQARNDFVAVRVYAHPVRPNRNPNDRVDFTETLYWNAGIKTDAATGEAVVLFALNDSVTTFRVLADAFGGGALGEGKAAIEAVQPFYIEPKLPLEVTSGDVINLPLGIVNSIGSDLEGAQVSARAISLLSKNGDAGIPDVRISELPPFALKALSRERRMVSVKIGTVKGGVDFVVSAAAGPYSDKVTRRLAIKPLGFPVEKAFGGVLNADSTIKHVLNIPADVVPSSITANIAVYPTPLANMTEALQRLIQEPHGCFEQTSSTTYPLVMAQQYFMSHAGVEPSLITRSQEMLDKGYKKLISFECPQKGYEWFAGDPGHEALTAFGLLEFTDMAQVREVDSGMLQRTREWLLKSRDGKGGFERKRRALHTWITDADCSNAYIVWALLGSGEKAQNIAAEISTVKAAGEKSANTYVVALAANVLSLAGDTDSARKLMDKLATKQIANGSVGGATASIVGSGGDALTIEATALATEAWLREASFAGNVEQSVKYLAESCKGGRYGSTQSTVLALRAIVNYDKARAKPKAPGKVSILVNGQSVGAPVNFDTNTQGAIKLPDISELLIAKGEKKVAMLELKMEGGGSMPYSMAISYSNTQPDSSLDCKVSLGVKLANAQLAEGGITEANVTVTNTTKEALPTPVAIVGIPGGLEVRHDQLKELVKAGKVDAYEVIGREVVLYWREMKAEQKIEVPLSLIAAIPGTYTAPASRAYLYYTDEHKTWVEPIKVTIDAK